ncbi:L,D-transpeptidase [Aliinostoc sp. HNIBRCY26]|uniref:L,D-transpeptidase n=1 Tax=Aliinostoc sp. HNIBRCY26 TaxID=3418997 RepID=UPI003D06A966
MKLLTFQNWTRCFKLSMVGALLSLSTMSMSSDAAWAGVINQKITASIQNLQKSDERWIQINLSTQRLIAWEGNKPVYAIVISSGKKSTPTRIGTFKVQSKHKVTRMRGRNYDVPNVPYAMFYDGNYGIHGAYWHRRFGTPVSHGCVNLAPNHAKWLFNWASLGTSVIIQK